MEGKGRSVCGTTGEQIRSVCARARRTHSGRIKGLMLSKLKCHNILYTLSYTHNHFYYTMEHYSKVYRGQLIQISCLITYSCDQLCYLLCICSKQSAYLTCFLVGLIFKEYWMPVEHSSSESSHWTIGVRQMSF